MPAWFLDDHEPGAVSMATAMAMNTQ